MILRLSKYLSICGITSRRKAEILIEEGYIKVNNIIITEQGFKIDTDEDKVIYKDKLVLQNEKSVYIMLNKPIGYITTVSDQFNRATVLGLLADYTEKIVPVGRLDYNTSGLLLLTNDGDLVYGLTHPKHNIEKTYLAEIEGKPKNNELEMFRNGLNIDDYVTSKAKIEILGSNGKQSLVKISITEGKNRQIRKMCDKINHSIITLKRVSIEEISLGNLKPGKYRELSSLEVSYLFNLINS